MEMKTLGASSLIWFGAYIALMLFLGWVGHKDTKDMKSFAMLSGQSPIMTGFVFASAWANSGIFVGQSQYVFSGGFRSLWGPMCLWPMMAVGMAIFGKGYRRVAKAANSIDTVTWFEGRYGSKPLGKLQGTISLFGIFQVSGAISGCAAMGQAMFGIDFKLGCLVSTIIVMAYITMGGAKANALTNTAQAIIMCIASLVLFISVWTVFPGGFAGVTERLNSIDTSLTDWYGVVYNDISFRSFKDLMIGLFPMMLFEGCTPHCVGKFQYLKSSKDMRKFVAVAIICNVIFGVSNQCGLISRIWDTAGVVAAQPSLAMSFYIVNRFGPIVAGALCLVVWAASMSTAGSILLVCSTIVGNTFYREGFVAGKVDRGELSEEVADKRAFRLSIISVPIISIIAMLIAMSGANIIILLWIGSCGVLSGLVGPLFCGIYVKDATAKGAIAGTICGVLTFVYLYGFATWFPYHVAYYVCGNLGIVVGGIVTFAVSKFTTGNLTPDEVDKFFPKKKATSAASMQA